MSEGQVGRRGEGLGATAINDLLTIGQFAKRVALSAGTIRNRISKGEIKEGEGLVYIMGHPRFDWTVFLQFHGHRRPRNGAKEPK